MSLKVVYPVSANPPTWGHADIMYRAAQKYDHVYWVCAINPRKKYHFTTKARIEMMQKYVSHYKLQNVTCDHFEGATVRYAKEKKAQILLRGLRNTSDFHMELDLATANRGIEKDIETMCIFAKPHYATISSSLVIELAKLGENIDQYVLPDVGKKILEELKKAS